MCYEVFLTCDIANNGKIKINMYAQLYDGRLRCYLLSDI